MHGLIGRVTTLIKAKISKLLERTENPAETLDYAYERQVKDLQNVKKGIADLPRVTGLESEQNKLTVTERMPCPAPAHRDDPGLGAGARRSVCRAGHPGQAYRDGSAVMGPCAAR